MKIFNIIICLLLVLIIVSCSAKNKSETSVDKASNDTTSSNKTSNEGVNAEAISKLAIDEFLELTKIPRPSKNTAKALEYLIAFANKQGLKNYRDAYGNFWMDILATSGYENFPKLILQAHMDMVCVSNKDKQIDFNTTGIKAIVDNEKKIITADGTSLGADNGVGIGMILAIAKSNFPHGPIRALITTDEEIGLIGAGELDASALDSDYLINIDNEDYGDIIYSTAGNFRYTINKKFGIVEIENNKEVYHLSIDGLIGGHSGSDIDKNRLSAFTAVSKTLQAFVDAKTNIQIENIKAGEVVNAITRSATVDFIADKGLETKFNEIIKKVNEELNVEFPNENIKSDVKIVQIDKQLQPISVNDSIAIITLLNSLPQGVLAMSKKIKGLVETSANNGILNFENGNFLLSASVRSCVTKTLDEMSATVKKLTDEYEINYKVDSLYPGWDGDMDAPLVQLTKKGYESIGTTPKLKAIHAGLECSWFCKKRKGIQMVAIGPTITDCHSPSETLYIESVKPTLETILYCIDHINELEKK